MRFGQRVIIGLENAALENENRDIIPPLYLFLSVSSSIIVAPLFLESQYYDTS